MKQLALPLVGGHHPGPLFVPVKRRAARPRMASSLRDRLLRRRVPAWADRVLMRQLQQLARIFTAHGGQRYSVDHIVPLNHPLVSGLHCDANLRVIPLRENLAKGNARWPDMPEAQEELL